MAASARNARLIIALASMAWAGTLAAQTAISIEQAAARARPDSRPQYEGRDVLVRGQVAARAIRVQDFALLSLHDESGRGLVIEAPDFMFEKVSPGDRLDIRGVLTVRDGMPVLRPAEIHTLSGAAPPFPKRLRV